MKNKSTLHTNLTNTHIHTHACFLIKHNFAYDSDNPRISKHFCVKQMLTNGGLAKGTLSSIKYSFLS